MATTKEGSFSVIGARAKKSDALERVTGKAVYGADIKLPGLLVGKVLRSPHPHANILSIDASKAEALPGVYAVVTAKDLPPIEKVTGSIGGEVAVNLIDLRKMALAHDKALYDGHPIAGVAAVSADVAERALELIDVKYEVLPLVEDVLEAMQDGAPLLHPDLFTKTIGEQPTKPSNVAAYAVSGFGDVQKGFAEADLVYETTYDSKMVHQGYIEPTAATAWYQDDGKLTIWTCTQGTFGVRQSVRMILDMPMNRINVVPTEVGGGFGGKVYAILEPLAALLSRKARRPVKIVMSRAEVFRATGPGSPMHAVIKTGVKKNGALTACYAKIILDAGAFPGAPVWGAGIVSFGPYKAGSIMVEGYDVVTNKPRVQAYRAPGGTPIAGAIETHMDEVAEKLGIDPLQFRIINAPDEGDKNPSGQVYNRIGMKEILRRVAQHPCWSSPAPKGPHRGRGLALGYWPGATLTSSAIVQVLSDGTVSLMSGQVDLTGTRTTMAQFVAETLQVPLDDVTARMADTETAPYTDLSAGSRTTYSMGAAVYEACKDALGQLMQHAADHFKVPASDVEYANGVFCVRENAEQRVDLRTLAGNTARRAPGPVTGYGTVTRLQPAHQFAAHVADVAVDLETGKVTVLRYTAFQDVGKAVNPTMVEGQMQGGALQGIGWAMSEYYDYSKGMLRNPTLLDYRIPTALDIPMIDTEIIEVPASDGPYGVRGIGEVPIVPPAGALANAIYRATGKRIRQLPMTPEVVFKAIHSK